VVALLSSLDSMLLGYDIGCVSGIIPFVQAEFGLTNHQVETFAAAMNSFAVVGALVSGWIADKVGRKPALFMSSCTFAVGSVMMALSNSYDMLVYSRYIQGFGVGAGMLVSPMFIAEVSPAKFRGALVSLGEVSLSLGILLAYCLNYFLSGVPNQWRWMIGLGALPDVLLALRQLFLPESPRFLLSKGKREKATQIQRRIMRPMSHADADAELAEIVKTMDEEDSGSWSEFLQPATACALAVGIVVAALQHAVGIESIIYYSTKIFHAAGFTSPSMAILGTVIMGLIKLAFESYSLLHVDHMGRRPLLLYGAAGLTTVLALTGASLSVKLASGTTGITMSSYAVVLGISAYMAFHALSYGPCTWLVLSEIFPNSVRGKAMGIATMANRMTSFYVASTFLTLSDKISWSGAFYVYAAAAAFSFVFYLLFVPETNGLPLEVITPLFKDPVTLIKTNLASATDGTFLKVAAQPPKTIAKLKKPAKA